MNYPTWSDLNNPSIVPPMGVRQAPDIGSVAVMISCEPDFRLMASKVPASKKSSFFISTLIRLQLPYEGISMTGPYIGAPYAAMILDSLIAKGAEKIIVIGWCGALDESLAVGDVIVPSKAIVDEGTSRHYKALDETLPCSYPDEAFSEELSDSLASEDIVSSRQAIWTTDAIYRETQGKVAHYNGLGAKAVEMECSALFSVAEYRKTPIAAALVVSDSVASRDWDPGFRSKTFKQARQTLCAAVMRFAESLCNHE